MIPAGLSVALDHGLAVFPCRERTLDETHKVKSPLTKHGCKDASTDAAQIGEWTRSYPGCAWGAAMTTKHVAVDVDVKHGKDGRRSLAAIVEPHGTLPATLTNETPSGGEHLLFRVDRSFKNAVTPAGIDIRSEGGFIIVPPSVIDSGPYRWRNPAAEIAVAPDWFVEELVALSGKKLPTTHGPIADGKRNKTLHSYACAMRARNVPESEAYEALQIRNLDCDPPLDPRELEQIFRSAWKYPPGFALTDLGNRDRLVAAHGNDLRYLVGGDWHTWTGHRFERDKKSRVVVWMGDVARNIYVEAAATDDADRRKALAQWAKSSESRGRIDNAIALSESHPEVVDLLEEFDQDPWLVGLRNGVYDLERDEFRAGRRDDRITKAMDIAFDPEVKAPLWEKFQRDIHPGKPEIVAFKQRAFGHSMSGDTSEQVAYFKYGEGANGKGTEQEVVQDLFGDYALVIQPETLMTKDRRGGTSNDLAQMRGARLITTSEIEEGQTLAENLFKRLTGEDEISARFLYQEHINFRPAAKFWISSNRRPEIRGTDYAIWRRILVIPYLVKFTDESEPRKDKHLRSKLIKERSGILNWLIEGFRQWKRDGLQPPEEVRAATAQYQSDMNRIANFVAEQTRSTPAVHTRSAEVYRRFVKWWKATGLKGRPTPAKEFHAKLTSEHGFDRGAGGDRLYMGCALVAWEYDDDDSL